MTDGYLSVRNFWKYQNADVWKKAKGHPPWFKFFVSRDRELDQLDPSARLLFYELLASATRHSNVLEADLKWLWAETRLEPELIAEHLPTLLKGAWLSQTKTPRRSRKPSRENRDNPLPLKEEEVEEEKEGFSKNPRRAGVLFALQTMIANGVIQDEVDLDAEIRGAGVQVNDLERQALVAELKKRRNAA